MTRKLETLCWLGGLFLCWLLLSAGRPPQKIPFQMVVRDSANKLLNNQMVALRISIKENEPDGEVIFSERHTTYTNAQGLASVVIGAGTPLVASLSAIDWGAADYFVETAISFDGSDYVLEGTQQIMSVPYALYAERAGAVDYNTLLHKPSLADTIGEILKTSTAVTDSLPQRWRENSSDSLQDIQISVITPNSISLSANCTSEWAIVDRGFCYATSGTPTIENDFVSAGPHAGKFSCKISPLPANTRYHVRPYLQTAFGITYGNDTIIETGYLKGLCEGSKFVMDHDRNLYNTVAIGTQCWMREDLRTTHFADGEPLSYHDGEAGYYLRNDAYYYSRSVILAGTLGSDAVPSGLRGPCPAGWHVPSPTEWEILKTTIAEEQPPSSSMSVALSLQGNHWYKSDYYTDTGTPGDKNATGYNETGFSAIPTGYYNTDFRYGTTCQNCLIGQNALFATSEPNVVAEMTYYLGELNQRSIGNSTYVATRCLKD